MKPSERIAEIIKLLPAPPPMTIGIPMLDALPIYLDEEQARRDAFESSILARLAAVERKTSPAHRRDVLAPGPFAPGGLYSKQPLAHVAHRDSLERFGTGHPSERCCKHCGRPTYDGIDACQSATGEPFCNKACSDAAQWPSFGLPKPEAIKCSGRMPEPQTRVLFFVPGRVPPQRWRTGYYHPNGYNVTAPRVPEWADDCQTHEMCSETYDVNQVTHWMPMPGDPP